MPLKRTYKKSMKKRFTKKTVSPNKNLSMVNLGQGFPKKMKMVHKYHEIGTLTSIAGSANNWTLRCNSLFDPNYSGSGHQPLYFDQCAALYDQYTVIGSRCVFKISHSVNTNAAMSVSAYINDDVTVTPTYDALAEQSSGKTYLIPSNNSDTYTITLNWSSRKAFGKNVLSNPSFTAQTSQNPLEDQYFTISGYSPSLGSAVVNVEVNITYIAIWSELKDLGGS